MFELLGCEILETRRETRGLIPRYEASVLARLPGSGKISPSSLLVARRMAGAYLANSEANKRA